MKQKKVNFVVVTLVCFVSTVIGISAIWYFTKENKLTSEARLLVGKEVNIKDFEKNTFQDIQTIPNNQKVWLIYLTSSCEACQDELQFAEQINRNSSSQINVVGVMAEDESVIKEFIEKQSIKFPVLLDKGRRFANSIKLRYFPSNIILSNGKIEKVIFGSPQDKTKLLEFVK